MKGLIFTYVLTYGGALASLWRPWYGLLIYIAFGILRPEALWHWSVPRGNYSFVVAAAFLAGWAIHGFGSWRLGAARSTITCLLVFWALAAVQLVVFPHSESRSEEVIRLSKVFLPVVAGATMIDSVARIKQLCWTILLAQGYLAYEFNLLYYQTGGFNADGWTFAGLDNNGIAITMCATVGLAFFLGLGAEKWWQRLLAFLSAGLMVHVVLFSMSRGGMLALVVTAIVVFFLVPKRPKFLFWLVLGIAAGLSLAGPSVMREFSTVFLEKEERDASATKRLDHWSACVQSMLRYPLLGVGLTNWGMEGPRYGLPPGMEAHNTWLQMGAEAGVPALIALIGFYGVTCYRTWMLQRCRLAPRPSDDFLVMASRITVSSIVGFVVSASFVTVELVEISYYLALIGIGVLRVSSAAGPHRTPVRYPQIPSPVSRPVSQIQTIP